MCIDWGEEEEDQNDAHFWEDNWDDDDIEDDFSKQLRYFFFILNQLFSLVTKQDFFF